MSDDRLADTTKGDDTASGHPQFIKLSPIATTAPPAGSTLHSRGAPSQLDLQPRQSQPQPTQPSSSSRAGNPVDSASKAPQFSRGSRKVDARDMRAALESFGRVGHLVERADIEGPDLLDRAGRDAAGNAGANPAIPPKRGGSQRKAPTEPPPLVSAAAVSMHARAACFISQRMQTSCSVSQFRQLKALLLYSFLQSNTDSLATCRHVPHLISFSSVEKRASVSLLCWLVSMSSRAVIQSWRPCHVQNQ